MLSLICHTTSGSLYTVSPTGEAKVTRNRKDGSQFIGTVQSAEFFQEHLVLLFTDGGVTQTSAINIAESNQFPRELSSGCAWTPLQDGDTVCATCPEIIRRSWCRASTSKGDTCGACTPRQYHIVDDGVPIGLREEWADGTTVRRIFAKNAQMYP